MATTLNQEAREHTFVLPAKRIHDGQDVSHFLSSQAYSDIMTFLMQLNHAMFPRQMEQEAGELSSAQAFEASAESSSPSIARIRELLLELERIIDQVPLDTGPRRFGNVSFRRWSEIVEKRANDLLRACLPQLASFKHDTDVDAIAELQAYFLGSFGSAQRLDYGTGHELSFLAFLGCIWKLGGFENGSPGDVERAIVLGVISPYLSLIRKLILTYTLEPAGSHGVWGLDDHSFLPYIFGSAQYGPAIAKDDPTPVTGYLPGSPHPGKITDAALVEKYRTSNMYFGAIGFIYDVKKGPFWEHSPTLFNISGVPAGWGKINKGMIKMYIAEVLGKFPVVQHFPFGSLFRWDLDPLAAQTTSVHTLNQPIRRDMDVGQPGSFRSGAPSFQHAEASSTLPKSLEMRAPWSTGGTTAPKISSAQKIPPASMTEADERNLPPVGMPHKPPTSTP